MTERGEKTTDKRMKKDLLTKGEKQQPTKREKDGKQLLKERRRGKRTY